MRGARAAALAALLAAACATPPPEPPRPRETYVVTPGAGGHVGTVEVTLNDGRTEVLTGGYRAMTVVDGRGETFVADEALVRERFGEAVAALPRPPATLQLFFVRGRDELTAESRATLAQVQREFEGRQSKEVWIIGHADTTGSDAVNDALSLRRAERVRDLLVGLGIPATGIVVKGRGKRDPAVRTPDNVDEPRNRRVEISVR